MYRYSLTKERGNKMRIADDNVVGWIDHHPRNQLQRSQRQMMEGREAKIPG